jgi:hypothetical protein
MTCSCNCNNKFYNPFAHRLVTATAGTTLVLTVTNNTNIADEEPFAFYANGSISSLIPAAPLPVEIEINGAAVPLWNKYGVQIQSNEIPRKAFGYYSADATTPHVILITTPITRI